MKLIKFVAVLMTVFMAITLMSPNLAVYRFGTVLITVCLWVTFIILASIFKPKSSYAGAPLVCKLSPFFPLGKEVWVYSKKTVNSVSGTVVNFVDGSWVDVEAGQLIHYEMGSSLYVVDEWGHCICPY